MSKRNGSGSGNIRHRSDGRWEGRYTVGFDPATGKQVQRSVYGKTQQEVRQRLTKVTAELDNGTYIAPTKDTVGQWLDMWLDTYVKHSVKPYTYDCYARNVKNYIKPALGGIRLSALSALHIQRFCNSLIERGLSPKTVKNIHGVLHRALERTVKLGMLSFDPADGVELPKVRRKPIRPLDGEAIRSFLQAIKGRDLERLYYTTLFSGCREGEVLGLTWDCVDFDHDQITINKQLQKTQKVGGDYTLAPTKNSRSRTVTLAPAVMAVLKEQQKWQEELKTLLGPEWSNEWNLVFTKDTGGHLCIPTVYNHFKKVVNDIGLPDVRFHDLRHTFAVLSLENGDDLKTLQDNLGHATAGFTLDVYGHVSQRMHQQSADRMEQYIQSQQAAGVR